MTYIRLLSFVLLQFLFFVATAQPTERWVEVQYMQRMKDYQLDMNTPPELRKINQFTPEY